MTDVAATPSLVAKTTRSILAPVLLFVFAVLPFLPAIHGEYLWDDDMWLVNNAAVHAWNGLQIIWNPYRQTLHFYPITFTLLWLEHKLWLLNPIGYHAVNMLCHASGTLLLYLCLKRLRFRAPWLGALLWAIHPIQTDSVAWVAEIKNALSGLFYFLAAWSYLKFERIGDSDENPSLPRNIPFYFLALFAFALALLSKTVTVTLPAALLIVLWANRKRFSIAAILLLLPFFAIGLSIATFTAQQERRVMETGGASNLVFTMAERIIISGKDIWFYLRTLLIPYPLMAIYPRWTYNAAGLLNYLPAFGVLFVIVLLFALRNKITRWPLAAFLFFLATLSPALGFINFFTMHYTFVADHYQYLACLGILLLITESLASILQNHRELRIAIAGVLIPALMMGTTLYASLFQSNFKMWSWNVARNPDAFTAQHNLGTAYLWAGDREHGLQHIQIALQQQPNDDSIQRTVGKLELAAGHFSEALDHFEKAITLRPNYGVSYVLLGDTLDRMERLDDAIAAYAKAIEVDHNDPGGYIAYGAALKKDHKLEAAARAYESAIGLDPGNMITRYNYGNLLLDMNRNKDAITVYEFILKYQPDNPAIWDNLAFAYAQDGQLDKRRSAKQHADAPIH